MNLLRRIVLILPLFLLSACMEYTEDIWAKADGSGKIQMDISCLGEFVDELEKEDLEELRGQMQELVEMINELDYVTKADARDFRKDTMHHFVLRVWTKKYEDLSKFMSNPEGLGLFGMPSSFNDDSMIRFEKLENGNVKYTRVLDPDADDLMQARSRAMMMKLAKNKPNLAKLLQDDEGEFFLRFNFHAPKVIGCNDPGAVSGACAMWKFPLDFENGEEPDIPSSLHAEFSLLLSTWMWLVAGVLFVLSLFWLRIQWQSGGLRRGLRALRIL